MISTKDLELNSQELKLQKLKMLKKQPLLDLLILKNKLKRENHSSLTTKRPFNLNNSVYYYNITSRIKKVKNHRQNI